MQRAYILIRLGFAHLLIGSLLNAAEKPVQQRSTTLFQGAQRCFRAEQWETAANWFLEFIEKNPESPRRNMATLLRAQSLFRLNQYRECFNELKNAEDSSGLLAAEYKFWMAECRYREAESAPESEGLYRVAAQLYAEVPKSDRLVAANVSEAMAHAHLEDWPKVVELLQRTTSPFQKFAAISAESGLATQGRLILAEALLRQNLYVDATGILNKLTHLELADQDRWRHQVLLARALIAKKRFSEAIELLEILLRTAENRMPQLRAAQIYELKVHALRGLRQFPEAVEVCQYLWQEGMPEAVRHRALLQALDLAVRYGAPFDIPQFQRQAKAILTQENLAAAQVALGHLHLLQYHQKPKLVKVQEKSEQLAKSRKQFQMAIGSTFSGHARIGLAWNSWQEQRFGESYTNFIQAANELNNPEERILSQFKAIESAFRIGDMQITLSVGRELMANPLPLRLRDSLKFLMTRAAIKKATAEPLSLANAHNFCSKLSKERRPRDFEYATLLLAQAESRRHNPNKARELLKQITPTPPLKSLVELESARTYIREKNWPKAIKKYDTWLKTHGDAPLDQTVKISFDLGWLHYLNNSNHKAKIAFENIVKRFPDHPAAARAQLWIADQLFNNNNDADYVKAEELYQKVRDLRNCPTGLAYRASLMAGRAALARRNFSNARDYFGLIIKDEKCSESVRIEAKFALSDTAILDPAKGVSKFDEAISILGTISNPIGELPTSIALQALGRIGDCHLQMAVRDPSRHLKAREAYSRVLEHSDQVSDDPPARFRAMIGIARSLMNTPEEDKNKRKENLTLALGSAKKVFEGATGIGTDLEPFWIWQSGLLCADIQVLSAKPKEAISTLERLGQHYSKLKPGLDARIDRIRQTLRESNLGGSAQK